MFNFKKHVSAADLSQKVSPEDIPGKTVQDKAAYISEYLDREIGERLSAGEITIDTAYKLLADTKITGVPEQFQFLERYRTNISNLIQSASAIKSSLEQTGLSREQISELILRKLLERTNQVFIPELIELNRTGKRVSDEASQLLSRLPTYESPEQISSIKAWISREIQKEIKEIVDEFIDIKNRAMKIPNFDEKDLLTMLTHTPLEALKVLFPDRRKTSISPLPSKFTDPNAIRDVEGINDEVQKLARKTSAKGDMGWTKILALSNKLSEEEIQKWSKLIEHPVEFNLFSIVKSAGIINDAIPGNGTENTAVLRDSGFRDKALRSKYYNLFYPYLNPNTGLPFISESENRYIQENFNGVDPRNIEWNEDRRMDFIKRSQISERRNYAKERLYEFISNGYDGPGLYKLINSKELCLDEAGLAIQFYFRSICGGNLNRFLGDLREIGLSEHYEAVSEEGMDVDPNYEELRLITRSGQEAQIIQILRNEFHIDAIPYQVLVPVPTDCPTNENNFDIDFMVYVDTLEYIDPITFEPKIRTKVMFVGEYYGYNGDKEKTIVDRGKPWVDPDGNIYTPEPKRSTQTGEIIKEYDPLMPGSKVLEKHIYDLKTLWKKRTYETIAHLVGTDSLSFEKNDLKPPYYPIAQQLDEKDIIYTFSGCDSSNFCKAKKLIDNSAGFELRENLNNPDYHKAIVNDTKRKCIRAIDSAILHYKFQNALKQAKNEFIGKSGFDRKTLADHKEYYDLLKHNISNALKIILSPNTSTEDKVSAQRIIEHNQNEMNTLENSPLIEFKRRFDQILSEGKHVQILNQYEELRNAIESGEIPADLSQLRNYLLEIDQGVFGFVPDPEQS